MQKIKKVKLSKLWAPLKIYLTKDDEGGEILWCQDRIRKGDIVYYRKTKQTNSFTK